MIIIDLDAVKTEQAKHIVNEVVRSKLKRIHDTKHGWVLVPKTPIYWMTKGKVKTIDELGPLGLPVIGTLWVGPSVCVMLKKMVTDTDAFFKSVNMKPVGKFRRPPDVLTDHDFDKISKLGANPVPLGVFH